MFVKYDFRPLRDTLDLLGPWRSILRWQGEALALTLAMTVLGLAQPLLIKWLVDALSAGRPEALVIVIGTMFAAHQLLRGGLSVVTRIRQVRLAQRVSLQVRQRLYHHILKLSPVIAPGTARGELLFRLTGDVRAVETLFARVLVQAVGVAAAILGALIGLVLLDWRLALIAVFTVPAFMLTTRQGQRRVRARADAAQACQGRFTALLNERLTMLEAIHLSRRERREARALYRAGREGFETQMAQARANARLWGSVEIVTGLCAAAVLTVGAIAVTRGLLSLGSLLAFHLYVQQLFSAIDTAAAVAGSASESMAGVRRVADLLAQTPTVSSGLERATGAPGSAQLEFDRVAFAYPGAGRALDGISLTISPGEHVAVVGPSGCGKSTLARALARLVDPDEGRILLNGKNLREFDLHALRAAVVVVPQMPAILAGDLAANIAFSRPAPREEVIRAARAACVDAHLVERLVQGDAGEAGSQLSGGQRQRLALARLFLENPQILVLDEPTSSVDAPTEAQIWDTVLTFARGRTLIAITHNVRVAARFPRVLVMERGVVVRDGGPEELFSAGIATWHSDDNRDGADEPPARTALRSLPPRLEVCG